MIHVDSASTPGPPTVSIIIPVLNDADNLRRCLESIKRNEYDGDRVEVIVADNGSTDDSPDVARRFGARVLRLPGCSVAALRNHAARVASGHICAFIDADHQIDPRWLRRAADLMADPSVVGVGAACCAPPKATWVQRHYEALRGPTRGTSHAEWLGSGNLAVRHDAFHDILGFDEMLLTCEDVDLCQRLRARGGTLIADERLQSVHFGDPETLGGLIRGEMWRGRDNLRVSLRGPLSVKALPSVVIPLMDAGLLILIPLGIAIGSSRIVVAGSAGFVAFAMLRALKILFNLTRWTPAEAARAFVVAAAYDFARAAAIIIPGSHSQRRRRAAAGA